MSNQQKYSQKLVGKHVLIIGGSSGLGFGVAEASLENGARVTISSSNADRLAGAVKRLEAAYPASAKVESIVCNIGDEATLEKELEHLFDKTGSIDHVVYTAGDKFRDSPLKTATVDDIKAAGMVRFFGAFIAAKESIKNLTPGPASSFTITSGAAGDRPFPGWSISGSYAGAHNAMTRGLAVDMAPIRVNCVSLGAADTEFWQVPAEKKSAMFHGWETKSLTGVVGKVEDIVEAYLYAMKDKNLTGSVINSNSGSVLL
ncbi:NAD(P)-binding protein [Cadophora sp. DSE1049]|nr:NAD(P)-binding protein [Cadophora sp. DSE1049]